MTMPQTRKQQSTESAWFSESAGPHELARPSPGLSLPLLPSRVSETCQTLTLSGLILTTNQVFFHD